MDIQEKNGTVEDLGQDLKECGFYPDEGAVPVPSLETMMAVARMKIDNALQGILAESKLPLFLFDYLITSVQNDIRKADLDMVRVGTEGLQPGGDEG